MKKILFFTQAIILLLFTAFSVNNAYAWGGKGHRLIGAIAWDNMTPQAREMSYKILLSGKDAPLTNCEDGIFNPLYNKKKAFISSVSWLDCVRGVEASKSYPDFMMYHADRYPLCAGMGASKCASKKCASDSLKKAIKELNDPESSNTTKRVALKIVIHLMGDLHQPLHVITTQPIDVQVKLTDTSEPISFHAYWDYYVIDNVRNNYDKLVSVIKSQKEIMKDGNVDSWVEDTAKQGADISYGKLFNSDKMCTLFNKSPTIVVLPESYEKTAGELGILKVAQAGIRLADIINKAFANNTQNPRYGRVMKN